MRLFLIFTLMLNILANAKICKKRNILERMRISLHVYNLIKY